MSVKSGVESTLRRNDKSGAGRISRSAPLILHPREEREIREEVGLVR